MWMNNLQVPFFIGLIILVLLNIMMGYKYNWIVSMGLLGIGILGIVRVYTHPIIIEKTLFKDNQVMIIRGRVAEVNTSSYGQQLVLDKVSLSVGNKNQSIQSKLSIQTNGQQEYYNLQEDVVVKGKVLKEGYQMNPSDMDYSAYLRGKGIVARLKSVEIEKVGHNRSLMAKVYKGILYQIKNVFQEKDEGIVAGVLLGEDGLISQEVDELYFTLGIGHLLALSGFHIGIITLIVMWCCKVLGISYYTRQFVVLGIIWGYTLFTGAAASTIRASIMVTVILIGRCLWEEEDMLTSIALAALSILLVNPFQLYQVGFQLSFGAILSIYISGVLIDEVEDIYKPSKRVKKILHFSIPPVGIFLGMTPLLAYHFFEVPFLGSLLNLLIIPTFGVLIPYMLMCLGISLVNIELAKVLGVLVNKTLESIKIMGEYITEWPLITLCIGRPSILMIILYYAILAIICLGIMRKIQLKQACVGVSSLIVFCMIVSLVSREYLQITQLYVGQGDASVVITPRRKAVLIDGGPQGKGRTVEKFLKYKGINHLAAAILSHPHDDHISGIIELIQGGIGVACVVIPQGFIIEGLLEELYAVCYERSIPIYEIGYEGNIIIDSVAFKCLWPVGKTYTENINENSAVITLKFEEFEMLYTGDIGKVTEMKLNDRLEDIDVLKVAHHGSKNSTEARFLLQTKPEYAMISCGINNLHGHPHQETLETLEKYPIKVLRTDMDGAITIDINKYNDIKVRSQIQEDKKINEGDIRD